MSTFNVQIEELQHTVTHLHALAENLGHAEGFAPCYQSQMGDKNVEKSIHTFFSEWSQGRDAARHNIDSLAAGLVKAKDAYRKAEAMIAAHCGHKGGE